MSLKSKIQMTLAGMAICVAASAQTSEPIKVGLSGPFTGGSSPMGVAMRDAMRLAVDEINKSGGVLGRQIQLVERDDEAKNERGAQVVQELIHREKVVAGLGIINTGVMLASARFYQEAKIPVMNNVATGSIVIGNDPDVAGAGAISTATSGSAVLTITDAFGADGPATGGAGTRTRPLRPARSSRGGRPRRSPAASARATCRSPGSTRRTSRARRRSSRRASASASGSGSANCVTPFSTNVTGCAVCRCVKPGMMVSASRSARSIRRGWWPPG